MASKYLIFEVKGSDVRFWKKLERVHPELVTWAREPTQEEEKMMDNYFSRTPVSIEEHDRLLELMKEN